MNKKTAAKKEGAASVRPIVVLLDVLGQRWALRILWELREERLTFRALQGRCDNVSPTSLNRRLKELRRLHIIDHDGEGFGYTDLGRELGDHLVKFSRWSDKWSKAIPPEQ